MPSTASATARIHHMAGILAGLLLTLHAHASLVIDDRASGDALSSLGTRWRLVTDTVMGGVSRGSLAFTEAAGRPCLRLSGDVSLDNNGGFVQASLELGKNGGLDARAYQGIELDVYGNGESYNLHLRTSDTWIVWQSYRATFKAGPDWQTLRLAFRDFVPYRTDASLDLARLLRLGIVAIGREMRADLCIGRIALYR